eukprot:11182625-Lingulodinium_polyedra.AAC.1
MWCRSLVADDVAMMKKASRSHSGTRWRKRRSVRVAASNQDHQPGFFRKVLCTAPVVAPRCP